MTPVTQNIMETEWSRGNCLQAAVASILDKPLEHVPHFALYGENWLTALVIFMRDMGYEYLGMPDKAHIRDHRQARGIDGYVIAFGLSPRGFQHCVIYHKGKMVHDPHPSRAGIDLQGYYRFEPFGKKRNHVNWIIR